MSTRKFKRSEQALSAEVGEDVVALHVANGACYGMEKVASDVWGLLAEPADLGSICRSLVDRYEVDPATCELEVGRLIDELVREGLVEETASA